MQQKNGARVGRAIALACGTALPAVTAAEEVEVIHWLVTGGESAAIQHVADKVEDLGTTWVELVPPDGGAGARALFTSRIGGGDPPGALFASVGKEAIDLGEQGILRDIRPFVEAEGLIDSVPAFALEIASLESGELYAVPLAFETQNFMWYSIPAFEAAGVEPPTGWGEFLAAAPALQEAGIIPIAVGAQPWQLNILHFSILTAEFGQDGFNALYRDQDPAMAESDAIVESFRILRELSVLADQGNSNRSWNDTLSLVAEGRAGLQVMGSWAGGELAAMGETYGTDWGCAMAGGDTWIVGTTGFMIPDLGQESTGQDDFVRALLDPATQTAFSIDKGSIPSRTDASTEGLSECSLKVAEGMAEGRGLPNPNALLSGDAAGQIGDLLMNFWADTSVTPESAAAQFADIILNDF
ncbi:ABC transporter substrate-binding protein [Histidinibacterium lentulum]|uniref:Probable sugar-binding periplasmic protein n=1 Tax=Histidinibacterium lentulum TaxID=2480588 RepID=A0A3N2QTH0_9RHOB|nr:ABC transporter substrate-binding protein [Histidinibacterium lentulum]ROT98517.1 carbohydrate ABC transporter substrate-binding protein [Histidinibacterium lentulum]